jgi:hypothetical protein
MHVSMCDCMPTGEDRSAPEARAQPHKGHQGWPNIHRQLRCTPTARLWSMVGKDGGKREGSNALTKCRRGSVHVCAKKAASCYQVGGGARIVEVSSSVMKAQGGGGRRPHTSGPGQSVGIYALPATLDSPGIESEWPRADRRVDT